MQPQHFLAALALVAGPVLAAVDYVNNPNVDDSAVPPEAAKVFRDPKVPNLLLTPEAAAAKRNPAAVADPVAAAAPAPVPTTPAAVPEYIFVVNCLDPGFRGPCIVLGAPPGICVDYFDFDSRANISGKYYHQVSSISSNTQGVCQFYKFLNCDMDNKDPGVTLSYAFDLASTNGTQPADYSGDYDNQISSWRC